MAEKPRKVESFGDLKRVFDEHHEESLIDEARSLATSDPRGSMRRLTQLPDVVRSGASVQAIERECHVRLSRLAVARLDWKDAQAHLARAIASENCENFLQRRMQKISERLSGRRPQWRIAIGDCLQCDCCNLEIPSYYDCFECKGLICKPTSLPDVSPGIDRLEVLGTYRWQGDAQAGDSLSRMIRALKQSEKGVLAHVAGVAIARFLLERTDLVTEIDLVAPVPADPGRARERGHHLPIVLAQCVGEELALPCLDDLLVKARSTAALHRLGSASERRRAIAGAFRVNDKYHGKISGAAVLLVDEVITHGTTLRECARVLLEESPRKVYAVTLAKSEPSRATAQNLRRKEHEPFGTLLWLVSAPKVGPGRVVKLLNALKTPEAVYQAGQDAYKAAGLPKDAVAGLAQHKSRLDEFIDRAWSIEDAAKAHGVRILTILDPQYPRKLRRDNVVAPPILYYIGDLGLLEAQTAAVVGTRDATRFGRQSADSIAEKLSQDGVVVVSGLALGIDAAAHTGAIRGGAGTIAVLGCGPDVIYPPKNEDLYRNILDSGLLISEYPPGARIKAETLRRRNRLIVGFSDAVIIVEAGIGSGTFNAFRYAQEQGIPTFVVPPAEPACRQAEGPVALAAKRLAEPVSVVGVLGALKSSPDLPITTLKQAVEQPNTRGEALVHKSFVDLMDTTPESFDQMRVDAAIEHLTRMHHHESMDGDLVAFLSQLQSGDVEELLRKLRKHKASIRYRMEQCQLVAAGRIERARQIIGRAGPRLILFDLDGVLADSSDLILRSLGSAIQTEDLGSLLNRRDLLALSPRRALESLGATNISAASSEFDKQFDQHLAHLARPFGDVVGFCHRWRDSERRLGVVTNQNRRRADAMLRACQLDDIIELTITWNDTRQHKPHPEPILSALELFEVQAEHACYVGDAPHDIEAAKAAGVLSIACTWSGIHPVSAITDSAPTIVLNDPVELYDSFIGGE